MQKPVIPNTQIGSTNLAATCYFNQTTFQGYLYTKMAKTYPNNGTGSAQGGQGEAYEDWPYAVRVEQTAAAASNTPTCLGPDGQVLGDFSVSDTSEMCNCLYFNTGT